MRLSWRLVKRELRLQNRWGLMKQLRSSSLRLKQTNCEWCLIFCIDRIWHNRRSMHFYTLFSFNFFRRNSETQLPKHNSKDSPSISPSTGAESHSNTPRERVSTTIECYLQYLFAVIQTIQTNSNWSLKYLLFSKTKTKSPTIAHLIWLSLPSEEIELR